VGTPLASLADALRDRYTIERELGRGGMATVYLAQDLRHHRLVAIKVLHAELAHALGPDRFLREIDVVARLRHPHILPLHDSGEAGGLLYYVMPYVAGESLRGRLSREKQLPIEDVLRIAAQVASALSYAHEHGVAHRDIKPENILVEGDQAVLADFGIASAPGGERLTGTGLAIGTPAYMSPEQASGERTVDGRSDQYSLACVLYEMLAGEPPFTGPTAQAVSARRLIGEVPPLRHVRPSVPASVEHAILRALAPVPADRFASAREFSDELVRPGLEVGYGPSASGAPTDRRKFRRRLTAMASAAVALAALGIGFFRTWKAPPILTDNRVVTVLPFRVAGADPGLSYLREGMVDLMAAKLTGDGGPRSVDPRTVISAWRQAGGSAQDDLPERSALALAHRLGAGRLIEGSVVGASERLVLTAALVSVSGGRGSPSVSAEGPLDSLSILVDRLTARLLVGEAGESDKLANLTSASLPAVREYLQGRAAYRNGQYNEAVQRFRSALEIDSTFALAGLGLRSAAVWTTAGDEATRGLALAWAARDRLSKRDRQFLVAAAGPRYPAPSPYIEDLAAWERVVEMIPDQPESQYELGDLLFHFGRVVDAEDSWNRAARAFARALALDSTFSGPLQHLIELAAITHDTTSLRALSGLYLSRHSHSDDANYVRWRLATGVGDTAGRAVLRARFDLQPLEQLSSIAQIGLFDGVALEDADRAIDLILSKSQTRPEQGVALLMTRVFTLNRGRPEEDTRATAALQSYLPPDMQRVPLYFRVLDALYWNGDTAAARAAVGKLAASAEAPRARAGPARTSQLLDICVTELWKVARGDTRTSERAIMQLRQGSSMPDFAYLGQLCAGLLDAMRSASANTGEAAKKLANLDSLARARVDGVPPSQTLTHAANLELARLQESRGNLTGALRALRRREYFKWDLTFYSTALREEGRIAALAGDRVGAVQAYQHYLAMRSDPEPSQKPEVEQVRNELGKLLSEPQH
jgi:eukaryotic-like serine/threonine-protein kinase